MSTDTKQAIRESNQQSIDLSSEWIKRLREVQTLSNGIGKSELPEIVVASIPHVRPSAKSTHASFPQSPHFSVATSDVPHSTESEIATAIPVTQSEVQPFDPKANATDEAPPLPLDALTYAITSQLDFQRAAAVSQAPQPGDPLYRSDEHSTPQRPKRPELQSGVPKFDLMEFLGQFLTEDQLVQAPTQTPHSPNESHKPTNNSESSIKIRPTPQQTVEDDTLIIDDRTEIQPVQEKAIQLKIDQQQFKLDERTAKLKINRVIDRILEKIPPVNPTSIAFVDPAGMSETSDAAIQCAVGLARRELGPILLIDANTSDPILSNCLCPAEQTGFQQVLRGQATWQACTYDTSITDLHFLPSGTAIPTTQASCNSILKILTEIKSCYRYICICGSSLEQQVAQSTASACDATYLVVNLTTCDQTEVKSTIRKLGDIGARTLGCISTE